ncbi:MAG TPA: PA14 domain-containing protein, partial [Anaerolineae bacterium]|nr:PA14 domain-containing protein [Anaerolineae bacterium]
PMDYEWHYVDGTYLEGTHTVKVEYYEHGGGARIRFWWEPSGTAPSPTGPAPAPASAPAVASPGPWQGEYFNNQGLTGVPVLVRTDAALDFNWGWEAPAAGMNRDEFSVRWSGTFPFEAGRYRFTTTTDDGVRLYVDDQAIVDAWRPMRGTRTGYTSLSQGNHAVRVEYFDRSQAAMARVAWQRVGAAAISPTPAPRLASVTCAGGPLRLDAWPVGRDCGGGGWTATIFVEGRGGDCQYTYAWERQVRGGPTPNSMTFELKSASRGTAIVGKASVTSAGQTVTVGLHIPPPPGCR